MHKIIFSTINLDHLFYLKTHMSAPSNMGLYERSTTWCVYLQWHVVFCAHVPTPPIVRNTLYPIFIWNHWENNEKIGPWDFYVSSKIAQGHSLTIEVMRNNNAPDFKYRKACQEAQARKKWGLIHHLHAFKVKWNLFLTRSTWVQFIQFWK